MSLTQNGDLESDLDKICLVMLQYFQKGTFLMLSYSLRIFQRFPPAWVDRLQKASKITCESTIIVLIENKQFIWPLGVSALDVSPRGKDSLKIKRKEDAKRLTPCIKKISVLLCTCTLYFVLCTLYFVLCGLLKSNKLIYNQFKHNSFIITADSKNKQIMNADQFFLCFS